MAAADRVTPLSDVPESSTFCFHVLDDADSGEWTVSSCADACLTALDVTVDDVNVSLTDDEYEFVGPGPIDTDYCTSFPAQPRTVLRLRRYIVTADRLRSMTSIGCRPRTPNSDRRGTGPPNRDGRLSYRCGRDEVPFLVVLDQSRVG